MRYASRHPFCEVGFLQQIDFVCLGDSAQGGQQIISETNLLASLNLLEIIMHDDSGHFTAPSP
jgi:hypothetical protein